MRCAEEVKPESCEYTTTLRIGFIVRYTPYSTSVLHSFVIVPLEFQLIEAIAIFMIVREGEMEGRCDKNKMWKRHSCGTDKSP